MRCPPAAPGIPHRDGSLAELIGKTPLVRLRSILPNGEGTFFAKLECQNPGGMKVRAALSMVQAAMDRGELGRGGRIVESTSGTLGLALAFVGKLLGLRVTLVADPGLEMLVRNLLRAYDVQLIVVDRPDPVGGWQEARRREVARVLSADQTAFWPDQYNNPDNPLGYRSLAEELLQQLPGMDVLVCSVGTGGHSNGLARFLRVHRPELRVVGVDSVRSTIFGQPNGTRLMRGLGSSIYPRNVAYPAFDDIHWVAAAESVTACRALAARDCVTGGWSVGAVALVASWYAASFGGVVATVFPDGPERYGATIFDDGYCQRHDLLLGSLPRYPWYTDSPFTEVVERWSFSRAIADPTTTPSTARPGPVRAGTTH